MPAGSDTPQEKVQRSMRTPRHTHSLEYQIPPGLFLGVSGPAEQFSWVSNPMVSDSNHSHQIPVSFLRRICVSVIHVHVDMYHMLLAAYLHAHGQVGRCVSAWKWLIPTCTWVGSYVHVT
jgi:hypothetical protein